MFAACGNGNDDVASTPPPSTSSPVAVAREMAAALPPVQVECPPGDEPRGLAFEADDRGLPAPEDGLGLAVVARPQLPRGEFRRSAATTTAVQFVYPSSGPTKAVVTVTQAPGGGWRAHALRGCESLTLLPGEG